VELQIQLVILHLVRLVLFNVLQLFDDSIQHFIVVLSQILGLVVDTLKCLLDCRMEFGDLCGDQVLRF